MSPKYQPPPLTIPSDYAETAGCDVSKIYHVMAGRKRFRLDEACRIMDRAYNDPRLAGLSIIHLRPDVACTYPHLRKLYLKNQKKAAKRKAGHGR